MSVESGASVSVEDRIHRTMTWYRVPLMAIATVLLVAFMHDKSAFIYGAAAAMFGELIQLWATSHLHKDTRFTISGPYSHVRNPMYFGRFFVGLGFFMITWNPYLIAGYVVLYAIYGHFRVRREERRLNEIFAPHYQHYCAQIRRWLPSVRPYSRSESRRASWPQVCANHEQVVLLGVIVVLTAVYLRIDRLPDFFLRF